MSRKYRRNFLPAFVINIFLWLTWFAIVFFLPPSQKVIFPVHNSNLIIPVNITLFFLTLLFSLTITLAFAFANSRRGFLASILVCGILWLRLIGQTNWLNLLLLGAIFFTLEIYFSKRKP